MEKRIKLNMRHYSGMAFMDVQYYANGSKALTLCTDEYEPLCTATVALDVLPSDGCVFIKDWSENEGIASSLVSAGIIKLTGRTIPTGYVEALEAKLLLQDTQP